MQRTALMAPQWLQEEHSTILEILDGLEDTFRDSESSSLPQMCSELYYVHSRIVHHFRSEENGGWMDVVRTCDPQMATALQQFAGEHRQLSESLKTLMDEANAAQVLDEKFCEKVRRWSQRVRLHEMRESELIQDVCGDELEFQD